MYQDKKISVAIATYNGEKYIREQLESILNQTVVPDEIIISDDGSKDKTLEIVQQLSASICADQASIHIIKNNGKRGYSQNFENAIRHTTGDIIFLCDQDDVWVPKKVEKIAECFLHNNVLFVFHNAVCIGADGELLQTVFNPFVEGLSKSNEIGELVQLQRTNYLERTVCCTLVEGMATCIAKELLEIALPFPKQTTGHDHWLPFCAEIRNACYYYNEVLTMRRLHGNNVTGVGKQSLHTKARKILTHIARYSNEQAVRFSTAEAMKSHLVKLCNEREPGVAAAIITAERVAGIGKAELDSARSGRLIGAVKLIKLYLTDVRYRKSGKKAFLYELADILLRSKKARIKNLEEMGL